MRCALVQNSDNTVINIIMADPAVDPATGQFTDPNPPSDGAN